MTMESSATFLQRKLKDGQGLELEGNRNLQNQKISFCT